MFQYNKLIGLMAEKSVSQKYASQRLGISENSFTNKMKCRTDFTAGEIEKLCQLLGISSEKIGEYFFTVKV